MDFALTDEQQTVRALADEILGKEAPWERVREVSREDAWLDAFPCRVRVRLDALENRFARKSTMQQPIF